MILNDLNDSQRQAVEYVDGPALVIAGAGSGKTRVLTYKIAWLLECGMAPWSILALTFTNKAANEMKARIGKLVGDNRARYINMGTFHSVFSRILRVEAEYLGYNKNFTIYDESDSRSLIKSIIKEMKLDDKAYKPAAVHNRISMAKNHLIDAAQYATDFHAIERDVESKMPAVSQIYTIYQQRCRQANAMDFDDLLVCTFQLFRNHEDVRRKYAERFEYVLVDEYQDTNMAQQRIVWQLTQERQRVCVVGDDAQSIYGFRGANIDNILDFQQLYAGARLFKLEQNYRSTQRIVQAANSLIHKNQRQIHKEVYSRNEEGDKLILKLAYSDKEEAVIVCNDIQRIRRQEQSDYSDFAILYRTNSQSRSFEEAMRKQNIPYRIYGGLSFYQRKEIKDVIAYFRLVANPSDEEAFKRIVNYPSRGIGDTTVGKITSAATKHGASLWKVISAPGQYGLNVNAGTLNKICAFRNMILSFVERFSIDDAFTLGHDIIIQSGISADLYADRSPENLSRQENLEEFLSGLRDFVETRREEGQENNVSLADFLQEVSLLTDLDSDDGNEDSRVTLMTIHSAKGLEFPTVFIVGLEENIFPSPLSTNSPRELEEERRLLYVAITRAERHCIMTCAKHRWRYGKMEFDTPSRFIHDIDPALLRIDSQTDSEDDNGFYFGKSISVGSSPFGDRRLSTGRSLAGDRLSGQQNSRPVASQFKADPKPRLVSHRDTSLNSSSSTAPSSVGNMMLSEGQVIEHERFGIGTVLKVDGTGENTKATVQFRNTGTKQLLLKFARFKII